MVDYSGWLEKQSAVPYLIQPTVGILWALGIIFFIASFLFLSAMNHVFSDWRLCLVTVGCSALMAGLATCFVCMVVAHPNPDYPTFESHTEQVFAIKSLKCDEGCPTKGLPYDRTSASWIQDGRLAHGTILVDGDKVGVAGPDGELLKAVKR